MAIKLVSNAGTPFGTSGPIGFFDSDFSLADRRVRQGGFLLAEVQKEEGYYQVGFLSSRSRKIRRVLPGRLLLAQKSEEKKGTPRWCSSLLTSSSSSQKKKMRTFHRCQSVFIETLLLLLVAVVCQLVSLTCLHVCTCDRP